MTARSEVVALLTDFDVEAVAEDAGDRRPPAEGL
jgi:hypothetical protein